MPILHTKHRCISFIDGMLTLYATSRTISSCMSIARAFVSFRFRPSSQYVVFGGGANISSMCALCVYGSKNESVRFKFEAHEQL